MWEGKRREVELLEHHHQRGEGEEGAFYQPTFLLPSKWNVAGISQKFAKGGGQSLVIMAQVDYLSSEVLYLGKLA